MKKFMIGLLLLVPTALSVAQSKKAETCLVPDSKIVASVADYAARKYHVPSTTSLQLRDSGKANDECYWKFHFEVASTKRELTLYLTPDQRYLTPTLYDRTSDPLAEEKVQRDELARSLTAKNPPSRGPKDAPVTVVEFSDFQCPYCQRLTNILESEVLPSDPSVRVVFKNFPLSMHPWAQPAALIAACAAMQSDDAFWKVHDYTFSHQKEITAQNVEEKLMGFAGEQAGVNQSAMRDCFDRGLAVGPVMKDEEMGRKLGVNATPTVFINGTRVAGIRDAAQLKQLIALARDGKLPVIETAAVPSQAAAGQNSLCIAPGANAAPVRAAQ